MSQLGKHVTEGFQFLLMAAVFSSSFAVLAAAENLHDSCASLDPAQQAKSADALLETGNSFFESGEFRRAEDAWTQARDCTRAARSWPKAVYNLGIMKLKTADYSEAIGYFNEVLQSHPDDKEPGGNIMETNRNYSNRSALLISECYEKMGDNRRALQYAWLARVRYPFVSWCGTCLEFANLDLDKRIAKLTTRAFGWHILATLGLTLAFVHWKKT